MIYRHVFIVRSVIDTIRKEVRQTPYGKETGGPLVGYISTDSALVVTHAAGPGPKAKLDYASVTIDGQHAQDYCSRINRESKGLFDYVGDWHRHPGWSLRASDDDARAMRTIAAWEYCPVKYPISLVYRSFREKYVVYVLNARGQLQYVPTTEIDKVPE